jgi:hypothetical protein
MSAKKAKYVRKYVDKGLQKGYICESESPIGYLLYIIPKGEEYYVYIDYCGLNDITIKNSYLLPLIYKL